MPNESPQVATATNVLRSVPETPPRSLSDRQLKELEAAVNELTVLAQLLEREVGAKRCATRAPRD